MGMMILHQQFHHDEEGSDTEDRDSEDSETEERRESDRNMDGVENNGDDVEDDKVEGEFSSDDNEDEVDMENKALCSVGRSKVLKLENEIKESIEVASKLSENGKAVDNKDFDEKEELSDYASGDEVTDDKDCDVIDQVAEANGMNGRENGQSGSGKLNDILEDVIASWGHGQDVENISPPGVSWSDSDDDGEDEDDGKKYNIEQFLKCSARSKNNEGPRKHRNSSNTSVDTSTTSGIGSYNEEHLDAEMGPSDSEKASPSWNHFDNEVAVRKSGHPMDIEEDDEEALADSEDDSLKVSLSIFMKDDIETLPLPSALKAYLRYYRD